jgi:hypothetical protein
MKAANGMVHRGAIVLAILCTGWFLFNVVAMPIYTQEIFLERGTISTGGEMAVLVGFVLVLVFDIVSVMWVSWRVRCARVAYRGDKGVLALGVLCLVLLVGEKALVDEIGREYLLGSEVSGEWIVLYFCLAIQLLYNILILRQLHPTSAAHRSGAVVA